MPTALVTGANSGIGHAFAKLLIDKGWNVYAVDRQLGPNISSLDAQSFQLDVNSPESMNAFVQMFGNRQLDLLLNVAGIMPPKEQDALRTITLSTLTSTFQTNAFGPLLLTQALLPNLLLSSHPRIGNVSSRDGSMASNTTGGSYAYRASKAALNSISVNLAVELREKGVVVVVMHPGTTRTGLDPSGRVGREAVEPEEAVRKMWGVLMGKGIQESGRFWHREGYELPW